MKRFNPVFFVLLVLVFASNQQRVTSNCFAAAAPKPVAAYGFESGEAEDWVLAFGGEVTNDAKLVLSGKASLLCDGMESDGEWHEFFHSDPANLQLKAKGTYTVIFKYKVLDKKDDCTFYYLTRTVTGGPGAADKGWTDIKDDKGKTGTVVSTFTLEDFEDYYLIIGTRFQGSIVVDDIKVFTGKVTEKDVTGK